MGDETINKRRVRLAPHLLFSLLALGFLGGVLPAAQAASHIFTPIDVPFPGAHDTRAFGINAQGQIVGFYDDSNGRHGFLATPPQEGAALVPFIVPPTAEPGPGGQTAVAYGWWAVPWGDRGVKTILGGPVRTQTVAEATFHCYRFS
jgi:probable HAF family extracellular repeat protein